MSDVLLEELGVPEPDYVLGTGSNSHAAQIARAMERLEPELAVPRAHVESRLRSDRTMPDEINVVIRMSSRTTYFCTRTRRSRPAPGRNRRRAHALRRQRSTGRLLRIHPRCLRR